MKARFWVRLAAGILLIALLSYAGWRLIRFFSGIVVRLPEGGGAFSQEEETVMETPEPMPTMPPWMMEDSFYDSAGSVGAE